MIKRYKALNSLHLTTSVELNNVPVVIEFRGGYISNSKRLNGIFITEDEKLQMAIESDLGYGVDFVLCESEGLVGNSAENRCEPIMVEEVKTRQLAIEWVLQNFNIEVSSKMNGRDIRKVALERGYVFPQWGGKEKR